MQTSEHFFGMTTKAAKFALKLLLNVQNAGLQSLNFHLHTFPVIFIIHEQTFIQIVMPTHNTQAQTTLKTFVNMYIFQLDIVNNILQT